MENIKIFVNMYCVNLAVCLAREENNWFGIFVFDKSMPQSYFLGVNKMFNSFGHHFFIF